MSKFSIGLTFIIVGFLYGSLAVDFIYERTLGFLVEKGFIKLPPSAKGYRPALGRKTTIIFYSLILISLGLFLLWNYQT